MEGSQDTRKPTCGDQHELGRISTIPLPADGSTNKASPDSETLTTRVMNFPFPKSARCTYMEPRGARVSAGPGSIRRLSVFGRLYEPGLKTSVDIMPHAS